MIKHVIREFINGYDTMIDNISSAYNPKIAVLKSKYELAVNNKDWDKSVKYHNLLIGLLEQRFSTISLAEDYEMCFKKETKNKVREQKEVKEEIAEFEIIK